MHTLVTLCIACECESHICRIYGQDFARRSVASEAQTVRVDHVVVGVVFDRCNSHSTCTRGVVAKTIALPDVGAGQLRERDLAKAGMNLLKAMEAYFAAHPILAPKEQDRYLLLEIHRVVGALVAPILIETFVGITGEADFAERTRQLCIFPGTKFLLQDRTGSSEERTVVIRQMVLEPSYKDLGVDCSSRGNAYATLRNLNISSTIQLFVSTRCGALAISSLRISCPELSNLVAQTPF